MADKPVDEVVQVDAALDALSSPTSSDVYEALNPFSDSAVAAVAAKRAAAAGGGSSPITRAYLRLGPAEFGAAGGTAFPIVASPGATILLTVVAAMGRYVTGTEGYRIPENDDQGADFAWIVYCGDPYLETEDEPGFPVASMPQQDGFGLTGSFALPLAIGGQGAAWSTYPTNLRGDLAGEPLNVAADNSNPGGWTTGNGFFDLWVWYIAHDITDLS